MDVSTGRQIGGGRFEVLARIGEGGVGVVYAVKDRQSDSRLALKTVRGAGPEALASLKREFRAVQDISHPNLVRLDELYEEEGLWFFTMELVDGKDWLSYVRPKGEGGEEGPDFSRLRTTIGQIVEALGALHANGMVHRDVKPTNVLVSRDGHVKLLDFGIVSAKSRMTDAASEGIVGTLAYMAPEQLLSEEPSPASDFYALGVMLHQALTGNLPYFDRARHSAEEKLRGPPTPVKDVLRTADAPPAPDDLTELCDALMRSEPKDRPHGEAILRALGAGGAASSGEFLAAKETFVGRGDELIALRDAYEAVSTGGTVAVLVEGASGVGKSALVRQFVDEVRPGALVLQGRCHEREYVPYKGIDAIVDELSAHLESEEDELLFEVKNPAMRLLPRLFPVLRRVAFFERLGAGSLSIAEGDGSELRARIFGAFRELIMQVAVRRPLVLTIDDVQWADGDSLALLSDLLAPPSPPPLLLLCTRRFAEAEGERASTPSPVALPGDLRLIRLTGLSDEDMTSLASRLSSDATLGESAFRELAKESAGHPLFLQELMRRRARGTSGEPHLRLDDALWNRVLHLETAERSLVEASAVAGVPTSLELIASAAGIDKRVLAHSTARLRTASLVKFSGNAARRRIEPYHDRVREAVVRNLGEGPLRAWHERLAHALEASPERDVERLALHWEGAGDAPRAAALLREAGDRASQAFAFDRAVELYQRSRALGGGKESTDLDLALAEALFNAGRGREGGEAFLALIPPQATDRRALELRVRAANSFFGSGYFNEGVEAIRAVLDAVGLTLPKSRLSVIFRVLWNRFRVRMRGFGFVQRDLATVPPSEVLRFDVCIAAGFGLGMADTVRGQTLQFLAARLGLDLGDPKRAARALCGFALGMASGGVAVAKVTRTAIDKARELGKGLGDAYVDGLVAAASGFATFMLDEWTAAAEYLQIGEGTFRDVGGASYELQTMRMMRGRALLQLGRLDELAEYQGPPFRDAVRRNDVYAITNTRTTVSALLAVAHDDVTAAESEIALASKLLAPYGFKLQSVYCLQAGCTIDLYCGRPEGVLARLEAHKQDLRTSLFERVQSIRVSLDSLRARAHLALAERSQEGRREHLVAAERCAKRLSAQGLPGAASHARLIRAAATSITGDKAHAIEQLRVAVAGFDDRRMSLHVAAGRLALVRLGAGDAAGDLERAAIQAFKAQGVVAPEKYAAHYAPGFGLRSG